jgi:hypothetical protein
MNQEVKFEELFLNIVSKYIKMLLKTFFYGRYVILSEKALQPYINII